MNIFRHVACAISLGSFILGTASLHAQAGGPGADTPTGLSGGFGGTIETGAGTFDPYERNSSRSVTDVVVPGAVTWHSRSKTWRSNWSWGISIWETNEYGPGGEPSDMFKGYIATYPDGRVVQFAKPANAPNGGPGTYVPRTGLPDRFVIHANGGSQLLLSDGSVINFTNGLTNVVNPLGQTVTISYSATTGTLIQEPAGRWIRIGPTQGSGTNNQTTVLTTSAGQSVTYTYNHHVSGYYPYNPAAIPVNPPPGYQPPDPNGPSINTSTRTVTYHDVIDPATGQPLQAQYIYKEVQPPEIPADNNPSTPAPYPFYRLVWASDPMFEGPLQQVKYVYVDRPLASDGDAYLTAVLEMRAAASLADPGTLIDRIEMLPSTWSSAGYTEGYYTRKHTTGDGRTRTISYFNPTTVYTYYDTTTSSPKQGVGRGQNRVDHFTDFTNSSASTVRQEYDPSLSRTWFQNPIKITDARSYVTLQLLEPVLGNVTRQTHPDGTYRSWTYTDPARPYYVASETDELGRTTTYTRDPVTHLITQIAHPGGAYETFSYNAFGQVLAHRLASGAVETKEYDARGLLRREYNSVDGYGGRKEYTYDSLDRVLTMQDGRARAHGRAYTTKTFYNGRHQPTEIHYASTGLSADPRVIYGYDKWGRRTSVTNELGYTTTTAYDAYGRRTSLTEPLNAPNWNGTATLASRTTNWTYDRIRNGITYNALSHTSDLWRTETAPAFNSAGDRNVTARIIDFNDRITQEHRGWIQPAQGSWYAGPDNQISNYAYDGNGNKIRYTDPQSRVTTYEYDNRDRLWKTTEPLNRITENSYDGASNKKWVKFPDARTNQWLDFDGFGQAGRFIDERGNTTNFSYRWGPMKVPATVTTHRVKDNGTIENQVTSFAQDGMGRPIRTTFPDASYEQSVYEFGQVKTERTRGGQTRTLLYDARGREDSHSWAGEAAPAVDRVWDDAGRLTKMANKFSTIEYTYDRSGQVATERNTIAGAAGTAQLTYQRYPDGKPAHLIYPNKAASINKGRNVDWA